MLAVSVMRYIIYSTVPVNWASSNIGYISVDEKVSSYLGADFLYLLQTLANIAASKEGDPHLLPPMDAAKGVTQG